MSFFDDLKNLHSLRQQATLIQSQMAELKIEGYSKDNKYKIVINGNNEVLDVFVPEDYLKQEDVQLGIKEAFSDARLKLEQTIKEKMMSQI